MRQNCISPLTRSMMGTMVAWKVHSSINKVMKLKAYNKPKMAFSIWQNLFISRFHGTGLVDEGSSDA